MRRGGSSRALTGAVASRSGRSVRWGGSNASPTHCRRSMIHRYGYADGSRGSSPFSRGSPRLVRAGYQVRTRLLRLATDLPDLDTILPLLCPSIGKNYGRTNAACSFAADARRKAGVVPRWTSGRQPRRDPLLRRNRRRTWRASPASSGRPATPRPVRPRERTPRRHPRGRSRSDGALSRLRFASQEKGALTAGYLGDARRTPAAGRPSATLPNAR